MLAESGLGHCPDLPSAGSNRFRFYGFIEMSQP